MVQQGNLESFVRWLKDWQTIIAAGSVIGGCGWWASSVAAQVQSTERQASAIERRIERIEENLNRLAIENAKLAGSVAEFVRRSK